MPDLQFNDNKIVIDQLLSKPDGLLHIIDEVTKTSGECSFAGFKCTQYITYYFQKKLIYLIFREPEEGKPLSYIHCKRPRIYGSPLHGESQIQRIGNLGSESRLPSA